MEKHYSQIIKFNRDLNFIQRKIHIREKDFIKKAGFDITHRELEYVVIIHDFQGGKLQDALETLDVSKSTWSNQIKLLINKKIIVIKADEVDKRIKRPKLTEYGHKIYNIHKKTRELFIEKYDGILSEKEIDILFEVIGKIKKAIKKNNR